MSRSDTMAAAACSANSYGELIRNAGGGGIFNRARRLLPADRVRLLAYGCLPHPALSFVRSYAVGFPTSEVMRASLPQSEFQFVFRCGTGDAGPEVAATYTRICSENPQSPRAIQAPTLSLIHI